jgi:hypothetical protein
LTHCAKCGKDLPAEILAKLDAPVAVGDVKHGREPGVGPAARADAPARVVVVDFDMPFGSMVTLMVKWALASVPALVILAVLATVAMSVFSGLVR